MAVICGDYLAAKGYGWNRIRVGQSLLIDVFNTHTHANYSHETNELKIGSKGSGGPKGEKQVIFIPKDRYSAYRVTQIWELSQGIVQKHHCRLPNGLSNSNGVLLGGDLNSKPDSLEMALLLTSLSSSGIHLIDSWTKTHPPDPVKDPKALLLKGKKGKAAAAADPPPPPKHKEEEELDHHGFTCQGPGCSFKSTRQVPERIDYLLSTLEPSSSSVTLKKVPNLPYHLSYSDHFAVQATFSLASVISSQPSDSEAKRRDSSKNQKAKADYPSSSDDSSNDDDELIRMAAQQVLRDGAKRCRSLRSSAFKGALIAILISIISLAVALIPSDLDPVTMDKFEGTSFFFSTLRTRTQFSYPPSSPPSIIVQWIEGLAVVGLALIAIVFSALSSILVLKGLLVDTSHERLMELIVQDMERHIAAAPSSS